MVTKFCHVNSSFYSQSFYSTSTFLYIHYITISKGQRLHVALGRPALACDSCLSWHRYYCPPCPCQPHVRPWPPVEAGSAGQGRAGSQNGGQSQSGSHLPSARPTQSHHSHNLQVTPVKTLSNSRLPTLSLSMKQEDLMLTPSE